MSDMGHRDPSLARPLTVTVAVLIAVAVVVVVALGRGDADTARQSASAPDAPGVAVRLDRDQARQAQAQAAADRFAVAFAAYLSRDTSPQRLRRAGASEDLVRRVTNAPHRSSAGGAATRLRPAGVVVRRHGDGWLAATSLQPTADPSAERDGPAGVPLSFRLEHRDGRAVVVDVNAGGRE